MIATVFWGVIGFLAGVFIAVQLAFPDLNFEPLLNFGRVRPLHTSAVIFAFGGNALIATSFYVVQRTCRVRLFGGDHAVANHPVHIAAAVGLDRRHARGLEFRLAEQKDRAE
jgi:cbb3-type cytochrome oxidase subunit 1